MELSSASQRMLAGARPPSRNSLPMAAWAPAAGVLLRRSCAAHARRGRSAWKQWLALRTFPFASPARFEMPELVQPHLKVRSSPQDSARGACSEAVAEGKPPDGFLTVPLWRRANKAAGSPPICGCSVTHRRLLECQQHGRRPLASPHLHSAVQVRMMAAPGTRPAEPAGRGAARRKCCCCCCCATCASLWEASA